MKAAGSAKLTEKSYILARERFEKELKERVRCVDVKNDKKFTLEMLGKYLSSLGLFHNLYNNKCDPAQLKEGAFKKSILLSQAKEKDFLMKTWTILKAPNINFIDIDVLIQLMLLLYDSYSVQDDTLLKCMQGNLYI